MKTETDTPSSNESLNALDKLLQQVIQPIIGNEFLEKISENEGFQDGKEALKKIRMISFALDEMKSRISVLPDEETLENKFCEHSIPNGLAECADDIHWIPDQSKENENDNAFSVPIIKIRDNLLREMSKEIEESAQKDSQETQKLIIEHQEELNAKFDAQKNIVETIKKEILAELKTSTQEPLQTIWGQITRQIRLLWCTIFLSCIGVFGTLVFFIFYLLRK